MTAVSIIIPCYNAASKIGKCFASLRAIDFPIQDYEVIFVDDCSSDSTYELVQKECNKEKNWSVYKLEQNSGSPSRPRNEGVKKAKGEYIFYFDCDDEILTDTLKVHYTHAKKTNACIVRGSLLADNGKRQLLMNTINDWDSKLSKREKIEKIISKQSSTSPQLIKRDLLVKNQIIWPEDIRMGEDTIFLANVLAQSQVIEYVNHKTFIYNKKPSFSLSTTQSYGKRDLLEHLRGWTYVQDKLKTVDVDYSVIRLSVGLQTVLASLINKNRRDIDEETFKKFSIFIRDKIEIIKGYKLKLRYQEIINAIYENNYEVFTKLCRPRLLVAGHDLKFIKPVEQQLSTYFDIKYDQWESHTGHNEKTSQSLLEWAEVIWCEWMLGNSEWYAKNKKGHQKLVIRMHRQELATTYAEKIDFSNVDLVFVVSTLFFERVLEKFPNIPRHKVRLLSNYIDVNSYKKDWSTERLYNLAMIGILPSRKNLYEGLEILKELRKKDSRYKLSIYSKKPKDLAWLARNKEEMAYFDRCDAYIEEHNLTEAVDYKGHCDLKTALSEQKIGFVLSLSESMRELPGFESFHLAVADGYAGGGVSFIKRWAGCEYIFPEYMIKESSEEIISSIYKLKR
ncbi:glycosyltransferase family 2 protein, partial [Acinetobacter proteolyticus]|uniref:glycosyltransferase family 2 protein n=1 Tax=Acinetobacter proteolyticus TaxID=1776741 RepID=UPI00135A827D